MRRPLAGALSAGPVTLAHGDLATVNMAFEGDRLILLDWAMPAAAPGALDIARFLVGCAHVVDLDPDEVIEAYRRAAGPAYDERLDAARTALRAGLAGLEQGPGHRGEPGRGGARAGAREPRLVGHAGTEDSREWSNVMDLETLYRRTVESWTDRVLAVGPEQWARATPCLDWDVRALVNHVVGEDLWTEPLVRGATIEEVGDRFDGDLLGYDPRETALDAADAGEPWRWPRRCRRSGKVHLSYGDEDMDEYVAQLAADHLIHGWDLAVATGGDTALDHDLVAEVGAWFAEREEMYRSAGAIGARAAARRRPPVAAARGLRPRPRWAGRD